MVRVTAALPWTTPSTHTMNTPHQAAPPQQSTSTARVAIHKELPLKPAPPCGAGHSKPLTAATRARHQEQSRSKAHHWVTSFTTAGQRLHRVNASNHRHTSQRRSYPHAPDSARQGRPLYDSLPNHSLDAPPAPPATQLGRNVPEPRPARPQGHRYPSPIGAPFSFVAYPRSKQSSFTGQQPSPRTKSRPAGPRNHPPGTPFLSFP